MIQDEGDKEEESVERRWWLKVKMWFSKRRLVETETELPEDDWLAMTPLSEIEALQHESTVSED